MTNMKDSAGRYLTQALFIEYEDGKHTPLFTLEGEHDDARGVKSLRKLYIEARDPYEVKFAREVFGDIAHWKRLCKSQWFTAHITEWRRELEDTIASDAFAKMEQHAKKSAPAAKWLAEKGWKNGGDSKRGRPSVEEMAGARKQAREEEHFYASIETRINE